MARKKRQLPTLPPGVDPTDRRVISILLQGYAEAIDDSDFDINAEAVTFMFMVEQQYPAALKDFIEHYVTEHFRSMIDGALSSLHHKARKRRQIEAARAKARGAGSDDPAPTIWKQYNSIGRKKYRQLCDRTRADLTLQAVRYKTSAATQMKEASFLEELATRLEDDTTKVGDVWSQSEVEDLYAEIFDDNPPEDTNP